MGKTVICICDCCGKKVDDLLDVNLSLRHGSRISGMVGNGIRHETKKEEWCDTCINICVGYFDSKRITEIIGKDFLK